MSFSLLTHVGFRDEKNRAHLLKKINFQKWNFGYFFVCGALTMFKVTKHFEMKSQVFCALCTESH